MEIFCTNNSILLKGSPKEIKEYLESVKNSYPDILSLIKYNIN